MLHFQSCSACETIAFTGFARLKAFVVISLHDTIHTWSLILIPISQPARCISARRPSVPRICLRLSVTSPCGQVGLIVHTASQDDRVLFEQTLCMKQQIDTSYLLPLANDTCDKAEPVTDTVSLRLSWPVVQETACKKPAHRHSCDYIKAVKSNVAPRDQ